MKLFYNLHHAISEHYERNAFCIGGKFFTYLELKQSISKIRAGIIANIPNEEKNIGLVANDDLETYASIIALWFEGKCYVPLSSDWPIERNENVITQVSIKTIMDSSFVKKFSAYNTIETKKLPASTYVELPKLTDPDAFVYILFTSGTTGEPKGVPISRKALSNIILSLDDLGLMIGKNDHCLQMSELTFDVSVSSFLFPLLYGACVYTIPKGKIKFSYIYELIEAHNLTLIQLVPSILNYLKPYFEEIFFPFVKYCILTAEALPLDLTVSWSKCIPNSRILNLYGPTENTIWSTAYEYNRNQNQKSYNGILSIGKTMKGIDGIIVDNENNILPIGKKGELCLSGPQLTPGYFNKTELTNKLFFFIGDKRYYKTGDLCTQDKEGDLLYIGRIDLQAKIQGFRVELSEVEFHVNIFLETHYAAALVITNATGHTEIGLVIESQQFNTVDLIAYLKTKLPIYMIPTRIAFISKLPINVSGKIDRNTLKNHLFSF